MRKTILAIIFIEFIILGVTGCGINNKFDIGDKSNIESVKNNVSLSIKEGTLTKRGATLILKNDSDNAVQYGNPYEIEIKKNGIWYKINVELNFTLPAYVLKSKESKEIELNWENGYGKLATGEYRIIKSIDIENEDGTFKDFYVSVEFAID